MGAREWYLSSTERGNPATRLDKRHPDGSAWTEGNLVTHLVHGAIYFAELYERIRGMRRGDLLMFVDWRGDPDQQLTDDPESAVGAVLCHAAERGVDVRGLIWRSHLDKFAFSAAENRHLGAEINAAGGECHLDMRVRPGGSHHQKFVVLRHPGRPERDVAFVGGIDLCHSRRDTGAHEGDAQAVTFAKVYGPRPPWHDIQLMIQGPAVADVETVFRERWEDPHALSHSPIRRVGDRLRKAEATTVSPLPEPLADPAPAGAHPVQLLRTYPKRAPGFPFAPRGERSVARGYRKAVGHARRLIYIEDQYLWSRELAKIFARALRDNPGLRLIAVLPHHPDQDGPLITAPYLLGRQQSMTLLRAAAPDRVAFYGVENHQGVPVYVHAKACVIDDAWASVGSDNFNLRSWTHDSELSAAVCHEDFARNLRLTLAREHLDLSDDDELEIDDAFAEFARSAATLDAWHRDGCREPRPPGRLRPIRDQPISGLTRAWATPVYRVIFDPDGRPLSMKIRRTF